MEVGVVGVPAGTEFDVEVALGDVVVVVVEDGVAGVMLVEIEPVDVVVPVVGLPVAEGKVEDIELAGTEADVVVAAKR